MQRGRGGFVTCYPDAVTFINSIFNPHKEASSLQRTSINDHRLHPYNRYVLNLILLRLRPLHGRVIHSRHLPRVVPPPLPGGACLGTSCVSMRGIFIVDGAGASLLPEVYLLVAGQGWQGSDHQECAQEGHNGDCPALRPTHHQVGNRQVRKRNRLQPIRGDLLTGQCWRRRGQ